MTPPAMPLPTPASLYADPTEFAALAGGGPSLLLLAGVAPLVAGDCPGLRIWRATAQAGGWLLHADPPAPPAAAHPASPDAPGEAGPSVGPEWPGAEPDVAGRRASVLPAAPAGVLAVLARDPAAAASLLACWGPAPPPLLDAPDGGMPWPALAGLLAAALATRATEAAGLHAALAVARAAAEDTRVAMAAVVAGTGRHAPPPPPVLALDQAPVAPALRPDAAGRLAIAGMPGVGLEGLCAVAVHLPVASCGPGSVLRARLFGAEERLLVGAWTVPGAVLRPGWLQLDLPAALGPLRQTACVDLRAEVAPGDALEIGLVAGGAGAPAAEPGAPWHAGLAAGPSPARQRAGTPTASTAGDIAADPAADPNPFPDPLGGPAAGGAPALRVWVAPFGRRYVHAAHWDAHRAAQWDAAAIGLELPPAGMPLQLPSAIWAMAAVSPTAADATMALGDEPACPALALAGRGSALAILPAVPVAGLDRIEATLAVPLGAAEQVRAALWLQPADATPATDAALTLLPPVARWSGWRRGAAGQATLALPLALPPTLPDRVAVVLSVRLEAEQGEGSVDAPATGVARIEWRGLRGFRDAAPLPPPPARPAPAALTTAAVPADALPTVDAAVLQERLVGADGHYRHLDVAVAGLRWGGLAWPAVRFKLASGGAAPRLEFRLRPDWPCPFETWPGHEADAFGPLWAADAAGLAAAAARLGWRDRQLLAALLRVLPSVVATAAREAAADVAEYRDWLELARRLAG